MTNHEIDQDEVGRILGNAYEAPVPEPPADFVDRVRTQLLHELEVPPPKSEATVLLSPWRNRWALGTAAAVVLAFSVWLVVRSTQKDAKSEPSVIGPLAAAPTVATNTPRDPMLATNDLDPAAPADRVRMDDPMGPGPVFVPTATPPVPVSTAPAKLPALAMSATEDSRPPTPAPPESPRQVGQAVATRSLAAARKPPFLPATAPAAAVSAGPTNTLMLALPSGDVLYPMSTDDPLIGIAVDGKDAESVAAVSLGYDWKEWPVSEGGNGHRYALTGPNTWVACRDEAIAAGGHLVTINDAAENAWLYQQFGTRGEVGNARWIGLNDLAAEGHWEWAGGDGGWWEKDKPASTSYVNWYPGTPEPNGGVQENAALINYVDIHDGQDLRGAWVDARESWTLCGIIEIEVPLLRPGRDIGPDDHPKSVSREPVADRNAMTIEIEAFVDGKDYLIIRGSTLRWRHEEWAAVGRHEGFNEPTVISTRKAGSATLDHFRWFPDWCDWRGRPIPPREKPAMSSVFAGLTPSLPAREMRVELTPLMCRNPVRVEQQPCADNSYTLIIGLNDTDMGAAWYQLRLTIAEIEKRAEERTAGPERISPTARKPGRLPGVVFVSDMPWVRADGQTVLRDINYYGRPIAICGRVYEKGVWIHSSSDETPADVVIDVSNRGFTAFLADAGVEQSSAAGSVQFQVLVDGQVRAESPVIRQGGMHRFLVDVTGSKQVTLRVLNGGDGNISDHAVWANARFAETWGTEPARPSACVGDAPIPGLVAHYPLDGNTKDRSGSGNDATEHGGITYADGMSQLAASFDGFDDFVEIPNKDLLNSESTIAFWVKLNENGDYSFVSKALLGNGFGIWLGRDANFNEGASGSGLVSLGCDGEGTHWNWHMVTGGTRLDAGKWHHIAAVLGASGQRLYIDGKETAFNPSLERPNIDRPIWLGREMRIGGGFLNGLLDEVRIYSRALSGGEIMRLYRKDATPGAQSGVQATGEKAADDRDPTEPSGSRSVQDAHNLASRNIARICPFSTAMLDMVSGYLPQSRSATIPGPVRHVWKMLKSS